jgi:tRNA(His) 5'-end guanylyltransferase
MITVQFSINTNLMLTAKKPYDEEYHKALFYAATRMSEVTRTGIAYLVTDTCICVNDLLPEHIIGDTLDSYGSLGGCLMFVSDLTAVLNKAWPTRALVTLQPTIHVRLTFEQIQEQIRKRSKAAYEMFLENPDLHLEPSLFGLDFYLPYEQTPQYFREGVFVERVLS